MKKPLILNWDDKGPFNPCSLYEWRLNWLEKRICQHFKSKEVPTVDQCQRWYDEEERVYQNNKRDLETIEKLEKKTAIIIPTHYHQSRWLKACLESCKKTGYFILLAYDNPYYSTNLVHQTRLPSVETLMMADHISIKHKTWASGVGVPHAWNMFYGLTMLRGLGFEYIFNINGDCIMERPEGIKELFELLGDGDLLACEFIPEKRYCGTMSYLGKTEILYQIWKEYLKKLYHFNIGNAEARMGKWLLEGGYKIVSVENPEDAHFKPPGTKGTWRKILGFRHLHAEHKVRRQLKMEPVEEKYQEFGIDQCFINGHERQSLLMYFKTGDKRFLEMWWQ